LSRNDGLRPFNSRDVQWQYRNDEKHYHRGEGTSGRPQQGLGGHFETSSTTVESIAVAQQVLATAHCDQDHRIYFDAPRSAAATVARVASRQRSNLGATGSGV
jgi:hypothetical protein